MTLDCKQCGAALQPTAEDHQRGTVQCQFCNAVTRMPAPPSSEVERAPPAPPATGPAGPRPLVPQPPGLTVSEVDGTLVITRRWFTPVLIFLVFFCIAWDSFLIVWYSIVVGFGAMPWPVRILMTVFPVGHVAVGVGLTYFTIAGFLNSTVVRASRDQLSVTHGPVPWWGNRQLPASEIAQLFCQAQVTGGATNRGGPAFSLQAVLRDGRKIALLSSITDLDQMRFIEQRLESFWGLQHRAVAGELPLGVGGTP